MSFLRPVCRVFIVMLLSFVCYEAPAWSGDPDNCGADKICRDLYLNGLRQARDGFWAVARRDFQMAYERRPLLDLQLNIGICQLREGNAHAASATFRKLDPQRDALSPADQESLQRYIKEADAGIESLRKTDVPTVRGPRPSSRKIAGGIGVAAGAVTLGWGIAALVVNGRCQSDPFGSDPIQQGGVGGTCGQVYDTNPLGGALVGVGSAVTIGAVILLALPGKSRLATMRDSVAPEAAAAIGSSQ